MLDDSRTTVLLAARQNNEIAKGRWNVVDIEEDAARISGNPETAPPITISKQNLAYVIYTSGSTGRPNGVQITHENLLNLIAWHTRAFSVSPEDRVSQLASFAFDAAVWELWPNLVAGSSVHFPDEATRVAAEPLRDWLVQKRITISFAPTPLAESLITLDWPAETALRFLLTGGDILHRYPPSGLPFVLVNNYGPTECTVVTTSGIVHPNPHPDGPPTIGSPIDHCQAYILDQYQQQIPVGDVGELYVQGLGLGRGYLNRPDLDAQRFVANRFSQTPRDRLYRTGDLVRYLPDGQIAFVGRVDEQIKIRGYRIEPAEIVAVLDQHFGVKASIVVARVDNTDKRLIAYVVESPGAELTHSALQDFLKTYLPDYMVPAAFVRIPTLPVTITGKVDRDALPVPGTENTIGDQVRIAPRNPIEERLVAILSELLGIERMSVNDNFFFVGGHSLLGTQLIARARDSFGVELPLRTVFDSPTAAELSAVIEDMLRNESMSAD
jgi:amino acid adenylation domain-containing protein